MRRYLSDRCLVFRLKGWNGKTIKNGFSQTENISVEIKLFMWLVWILINYTILRDDYEILRLKF